MDGTQGQITITSQIEGIYLVSFTPKVSGVTTGYRAGVFINGIPAVQSRTSFASNSGAPRQEAIPLSLAIKLNANDRITFDVQADNVGQSLVQGSSRSILQIDVASSNLTEGMSAQKTANTRYTSTTPTTISGWSTASAGNFLAKNISITPAGALAVLRAGVFKMSAQIIVRNPSNQARFHNYILH